MRHAEKSSITKWWLCIFSSISILLEGLVCQLIFTGAQEDWLRICASVFCSSFWWQNAKVKHAMPNIPETSSTIAIINDVLLFLLCEAYRAAKTFKSFPPHFFKCNNTKYWYTVTTSAWESKQADQLSSSTPCFMKLLRCAAIHVLPFK